MCELSLGRAGAGRQGHYVYIVQTIYLIFIKIKRSLFIPVYVKQSQGVQFPSCWPGSRGGGSWPEQGRAALGCSGARPVPGRALHWPVPFLAAGVERRGVRGPPPRVLGRQPWAYLFLD